MIRKTSIESYNAIVNGGLLGKRQTEVYQVLYEYGPLTANEVFDYLKEKVDREFRYDSNTRARFTELRALGVIEELGERQCTITGRSCIVWDTTNYLPSTPKEAGPTQCLMDLWLKYLLPNAITNGLTYQSRLQVEQAIEAFDSTHRISYKVTNQ